MIIFIDDILIYLRTKGEQAKHLRLVLQILREWKLYAMLSKCKFWMKEAKFLGYIMSQGEISVDPNKVEAVVGWEQTTTVTKVRSFLGLARYYR